jgi:hypothetical protein
MTKRPSQSVEAAQLVTLWLTHLIKTLGIDPSTSPQTRRVPSPEREEGTAQSKR